MDKEYQAVLKEDPTLAVRADLYRTMPGVGPLTVAILVAGRSHFMLFLKMRLNCVHDLIA